MRPDLQILLYGECDLKDIPVSDSFHVFRDLWNRPEEEVLKKQKSEICYLIKKKPILQKMSHFRTYILDILVAYQKMDL